MDDLFYLAVTFVFFALMVALVWGCDKIVGPDDEALGAIPATDELDEVTL